MSPTSASAQFLRETEVRRGIELLYFGQGNLLRAMDAELDDEGLGRAHQRVLYFVARRPDLSVGELLALLGITKQSLGRVVNELSGRGLIETRTGTIDGRRRTLRLTAEGLALEQRLFERLRTRLSSAYLAAGPEAVAGFWTVLERLVAPGDRTMVAALNQNATLA